MKIKNLTDIQWACRHSSNRNEPTWTQYRIFDVDENGDCHIDMWASDYKSLDWLKKIVGDIKGHSPLKKKRKIPPTITIN